MLPIIAKMKIKFWGVGKKILLGGDENLGYF